MTIFDSKPFQFGNTPKSVFCDKFEVANWNLYKSDDYKNKSEISSPKRTKKKVTFADDNGQDLIQVLTIDNSKFPDLKYLPVYEKPNNSIYVPKSEDRKSICQQSYDWATSFIQPASVYTRFKSELSQQKIKLATAVMNKISTTENSCEFEMIGIIKLVNLCFEKRVFVRLSSDSTWTSFTDFEAKYKNSSSEFLPNINEACYIDEFEFQISLSTNEVNEATHREFVIGLETPEMGNYWDNNNSKNYRIDYCQLSADVLSNGLTSHNPYTHDYKPNMKSFQTGYTGYRAWNHFSEELNFY